MEMKQVERSSVQIPNRCVVRVPPTAPWRQGTVTQPSGPSPWPRLCTITFKLFSNLPNLSRNPHIFLQFCLKSSADIRAITGGGEFKIRSYSRTRRVLLFFLFFFTSVLCLPVAKKFVDYNDEDRSRVIPVVLSVSRLTASLPDIPLSNF